MPSRIITFNDHEAQKEARNNRSIEIDNKFNEINKKLDKIINSNSNCDEVKIQRKIDELYEKLKYESIMYKCSIKRSFTK